MKRWFSILCLTLSCAHGPREATPGTALSPEAEILEHELVPGGPDCGGAVCDRFVIHWSKNGRTRIELLDLPDATLQLDGVPQTARAMEVDTEIGGHLEVRVAGPRPQGDRPYRLAIDPKPYHVEEPPRSALANRSAEVLRRPVTGDFERNDKTLFDTRWLTSQGWARAGAASGVLAGEIAQIPVKADRCYVFIGKLAKGAAFSDFAQRGVWLNVELKGGRGAANGFVNGLGFSTGSFCADVDGMARITGTLAGDVDAEGKPRRDSSLPLGNGPVAIEIYQRKSEHADDRTAADLEKAIRKATAGYIGAAPVRGNLAVKSIEIPLPLKRGDCYAVALRLAPGAQFSLAVRKSAVIFEVDGTVMLGAQHSESSGGRVGPGGVSRFSCALQNAQARVRIHGSDLLGSGSYSVQLFHRRASEPELAAELKQYRADLEQARIEGMCAPCLRLSDPGARGACILERGLGGRCGG